LTRCRRLLPMLRKTLAGLTLVAAALIANPFNTADAATGRRGDVRQCVTAGRQDRTQAQNALRQAVRAARNLPAAQQQAAVEAARTAFQTAAQKANSDFVACIQAIDTGA
jgi:hypothetical protein